MTVREKLGKRLYSKSTETVDVNGEVKERTEENVVLFPQEPAYVKMYLDDLTSLLKLPEGSKTIIYELLKYLRYDGRITITKGIRNSIAAKININEGTIKNQITVLCRAEVLKRIERSEYEFNPYLFAKGEWSEIFKRRSNFRMVVNYTYEGNKTIITELQSECR